MILADEKIRAETNLYLKGKVNLKYENLGKKILWISIGDTTIYFSDDGRKIIADIADQLIYILEE